MLFHVWKMGGDFNFSTKVDAGDGWGLKIGRIGRRNLWIAPINFIFSSDYRFSSHVLYVGMVLKMFAKSVLQKYPLKVYAFVRSFPLIFIWVTDNADCSLIKFRTFVQFNFMFSPLFAVFHQFWWTIFKYFLWTIEENCGRLWILAAMNKHAGHWQITADKSSPPLSVSHQFWGR